MTWKSTAVVSSAGLLATWLASYSPAPSTAGSAAAPDVSPVSTAASTIEREADRLQLNLRPRPAYELPARNLFRFRAADRRTVSAQAAPVAAVSTPPPVVAPSFKLTGIASDIVDGRPVRTAMIRAGSGLLFVREGESVEGFTVAAITDDAVEMTAPDRPSITLR